MQPAAMRDEADAVPRDRPVSFDAVVRERYDQLLRLAWLLTSDRHEAEDAVAEALAKSLRRWDATSIANPAAYLRRAVINEVNSSLRRLRTRRTHRARRRGDDRGQRPADQHVVDADAVATALARLPAKQRTAVALRFYEGLSQAETAAAMGCSVGAAKSNCARGLKALRTELEGKA
jgi:RNA polymerase sigma-70 factor (sigma-E family)